MRIILSQVDNGLVQKKIWSKIRQNVENNLVAETLSSCRVFLRVSQWSEKGRLKPVPSMLKKQAWRRTWTSCCSLYLFTNLQHEIKDCQRLRKTCLLVNIPNINNGKMTNQTHIKGKHVYISLLERKDLCNPRHI